MARETLNHWLQSSGIEDDIATVLDTVSGCATDIAQALRVAAATGQTGAVGSVNVQGEDQKAMDVIANNIFLDRGRRSGALAAMVSEELDDVSIVSEAVTSARLALVFDPLDGSSNLDVNGAVGSIFSILSVNRDGPLDRDSVLQHGARQLAAGYVLYGPATMMAVTSGDGVHVFGLDAEGGEFTATGAPIRLPPRTSEFSINAARRGHWYPQTRRYIENCLAGSGGPYGQSYTMRWSAAMVADVHRVLTRGGIFLYPEDQGNADKGGRLRLLYEANPMAMLIEAAGGLASTGTDPILEVAPQGLHQRVGVVLGSRDEVERYIAEGS